MPASLALNQDYKVVDNPLTVTFTSKRSSGDLTDSVAYAQRFDTRRHEHLGSEVFGSEGVTWELPVAEMTYDPKEGDIITHSGVSWRVLDARKITFDTIWQCRCAKER